ncbi:hypothetical protein JW979_09530 [bacterium]|nr:hypothetical protein [candidate division CSSED10-310 bacterium]
MMLKTGCVFSLFLIVSCVGFATSQEDNFVWFDVEGLYHQGSPLEYLSTIQSGVIEDPVVKHYLSNFNFVKEGFTSNQLYSFAEALLIAKTSFSIYPMAKDKIDFMHRMLQQQFNAQKNNPKRRSLMIKGYGIKADGPINLLGTSMTNHVIAVPADPEIVRDIWSLPEITVSAVDEIFVKAASKRPWKELASQAEMTVIGRTEVKNLVPGPWFIWVNQYDMLSYLYRIYIDPENTAEITLTKHFALQTIRTKKQPEE